MFLALDGIDGCGKSTQHRLLVDWLRSQGREVVTCRDPGSTRLGEALRDVLLRRMEIHLEPRAEALIYMAARAALVEEIIRPAIKSGKIVVSDRFLLANIAYQGYGLELGAEMLRQLGQIATQGVLPDLTLVLDLELEEAQRRRGSGGDRLERRPAGFFARVRDGFLREAELDPERIQIVLAEGSVDAVQARIRAAVEPLLARRWSQPA